MEFDRTRRTATTSAAAGHRDAIPGKRTLTEDLPVQRREAAAEHPDRGTAASPALLQIPAGGGTRPTLQMLFGVRRTATDVGDASRDLPSDGTGATMPGPVQARM